MKYLVTMGAVWAIINSAYAGESMKIQINGTEYVVQTDDNETVADIVANAPVALELSRYAGHEYTATLPFAPRDSATHTSRLMSGHVYWWAMGNSFVINFADYDIAPYKNVHIGHITDTSVVDLLQNAGGTISIRIIK